MAQKFGLKSESLRLIFFDLFAKNYVMDAQISIANTFGVWIPATETMQTIMYMESSAANEITRRREAAKGV